MQDFCYVCMRGPRLKEYQSLCSFECLIKYVCRPEADCQIQRLTLTYKGIHHQKKQGRRVVYEHYHKRLPYDKKLWSTCGNPCCLNKDHIQAVSLSAYAKLLYERSKPRREAKKERNKQERLQHKKDPKESVETFMVPMESGIIPTPMDKKQNESLGKKVKDLAKDPMWSRDFFNGLEERFAQNRAECEIKIDEIVYTAIIKELKHNMRIVKENIYFNDEVMQMLLNARLNYYETRYANKIHRWL